MAELTAAEKAELRRQKILARKKARMAFVVEGDRSQLPSTTDTNTSDSTNPLPPTTATPTDTNSITTTEHKTETERSTSPEETDVNAIQSSSTTTEPTPMIVSNPEMIMEQNFPSSFFPTSPLSQFTATYPPPPPPPKSLIQLGLIPRILLLITTAIIFALPENIIKTPFSVVESFIFLRVVVDGIPLLLSTRYVMHQLRSSQLSWLDIATRIPRAYLFVQSMWREFALYMTITFISLYLLELNNF